MKRALLLLAAPALLGAQETQDSQLRIIDLQEAITLAQRNAPAAVQARGQVRSAHSAQRSAFGNFMPSLSASLGQTQQGGQRWDNVRNQVVTSNNPWSYSTGLSSSLNLFDGGRRLAEYNARKAEVGSAEVNEISQRFNVALSVKTQYAQILAARESEAAARAQLEQSQQQLRAASARVQAGAATMSDSLRSVIAVGNAQLALLQAQNNLRVASATLTRLVGTPFLVTANPADTLDTPVATIDSVALAQLALNGPAVRQAQAQVTSARAGSRAARTAYLPSVDLNFSYSGNGNDQLYGLGSGQQFYGHNLRLGLSYPLFNNFNREDNVTRASVAADNAESQLRDARLAAQQNIIQQLGALRTAEARMTIQQASVAAAEEDLRVQQQRYSLGASTLLDLLTSQTQLNTARAALIQARQDYRIARAQIEATIGQDLD